MSAGTSPVASASVRFAAPIWTLLILAPLIAEVLSGSTRFSILFVFIPEVMVWGVGALLAREFVRRWHAGGVSLLLLGLALSVAEEFVIQQTSIAPLPFFGVNASYARLWGVNWLYFLFMLGYESVWVVLIPVQITELLFPARRGRPWLRGRGIAGCCVSFVIGSFLAWYGWTQQARIHSLHAAPYQPPVAALAAGVVAIVALIALAYALRRRGHAGSNPTRKAVNPWVAGIAAFVLSAVWYVVIVMVFNPHPGHPASAVLLAAVAWAVLAFVLLGYWAASSQWSDMHRWAVAFAPTVSCMTCGYLSTAGWSRLDLTAKIVLNVLAFAGLLWLGVRVHRRNHASAGRNPAPGIASMS